MKFIFNKNINLMDNKSIDKLVSINEQFMKIVINKLDDIENRLINLETQIEDDKNIKKKFTNAGKKWVDEDRIILIKRFEELKNLDDYKNLLSDELGRSPYSIYCQLVTLNLIKDEITKLRCKDIESDTFVKILFKCDKDITEISKITKLSEESIEQILVKLDLIELVDEN